MHAARMDEQYYTVQQVAERLQVTRQAVYSWIEQGRLAAVKVGRSLRITGSAVAAFIEQVQPGEPISDDEEPTPPRKGASRG